MSTDATPGARYRFSRAGTRGASSYALPRGTSIRGGTRSSGLFRDRWHIRWQWRHGSRLRSRGRHFRCCRPLRGEHLQRIDLPAASIEIAVSRWRGGHVVPACYFIDRVEAVVRRSSVGEVGRRSHRATQLAIDVNRRPGHPCHGCARQHEQGRTCKCEQNRESSQDRSFRAPDVQKRSSQRMGVIFRNHEQGPEKLTTVRHTEPGGPNLCPQRLRARLVAAVISA